MTPVDMSDRAISLRIRQVSQLRRLCLSLAKAKPIPPSQPSSPGAAKPQPC